MAGFLSCVGGNNKERGGGGESWFVLRGGSGNFFNRSPITLKIEAGKNRERESRKREIARARVRARAHAIASNLLLFYARKLMFILVIVIFTCKL